MENATHQEACATSVQTPGVQTAFMGWPEAGLSGCAPDQAAPHDSKEQRRQGQAPAGANGGASAEVSQAGQPQGAEANAAQAQHQAPSGYGPSTCESASQGYAAPQGYGAPQGYAAPQGPGGAVGGPVGGPQFGPLGPVEPEHGGRGKPGGVTGKEPGHVCTCGKHEAEAAPFFPGAPGFAPGPQPGFGPQPGSFPAGNYPPGSLHAGPTQPGASHSGPAPAGPSAYVTFQPGSPSPHAPGYAPPYPGAHPGAYAGAPAGPSGGPFVQPPFGPQPGMAFGPQPGMAFGPQPGMAFGPQPAAAPGPQPHEQSGDCSGKKGGAGGPAGFGGFPGFAGPSGFGAPAFAAMAGMAGEDPQHLQNRYGQMVALCGDIMQGKADPMKIASFLTASGTHFWKGAIVGAVATFLLTNDSVKSALGECFGGTFGGSKTEPAA